MYFIVNSLLASFSPSLSLSLSLSLSQKNNNFVIHSAKTFPSTISRVVTLSQKSDAQAAYYAMPTSSGGCIVRYLIADARNLSYMHAHAQFCARSRAKPQQSRFAKERTINVLSNREKVSDMSLHQRWEDRSIFRDCIVGLHSSNSFVLVKERLVNTKRKKFSVDW